MIKLLPNSERKGIYSLDPDIMGSQPVMIVHGRTIPETWQNANIALNESKSRVHTSFDREGDPAGSDASIVMVVEEPLAEPRITKIFPGGIGDLEVYRLEVIFGIHDHWVDRFSPKWNYTYHERLRAWRPLNVAIAPRIQKIIDKHMKSINRKDKVVLEKALMAARAEMEKLGLLKRAFVGKPTDQIARVIQDMIGAEDFFRRRFAISTWTPNLDALILDPPCLQRMHFRLLPGIHNDELVLNVNTDWRSRDCFKAAFMNMYAITDMVRLIAKEVERGRGQKVIVGRYKDFSDSLHIYGAYSDFEPNVKRMMNTPLEELTYRTKDVLDMLRECRIQTAGMLEYERRTGNKQVLPPESDKQNYDEITVPVNEKTFPYPKEWDE